MNTRAKGTAMPSTSRTPPTPTRSAATAVRDADVSAIEVTEVPPWIDETDRSAEGMFIIPHLISASVVSKMVKAGIPRSVYIDILKNSVPDGPLMVTIASGIDSKIRDDMRLIVPKDAAELGKHVFPFFVAAHTVESMAKFEMNGFPAKLVALAAYTIAKTGLIAEVEDIKTKTWEPDGDWVYTDKKVTSEMYKKTNDLLSSIKQYTQTMASMIVATKASFWNSNHHTAVREQQLPKALERIQVNLQSETSQTVSRDFMHTAGHWASTLACLTYMKKSVRKVRVVGEVTLPIHANDDFLVRFDTLPAGCHKLGFCFQAFALMSGTKISNYLTPEQGAVVARTTIQYYRIMKEPTSYHIGALYLTGKPRVAYDDSQAPGGMAIPYIMHSFMGSTLVKSPYYASFKEGGYRALPYYSQDFEKLVQTNEAAYASAEVAQSVIDSVNADMAVKLSRKRPMLMVHKANEIIKKKGKTDKEMDDIIEEAGQLLKDYPVGEYEESMINESTDDKNKESE